jgi:lipopolysaccharide biosynthesis glycosyltransferase
MIKKKGNKGKAESILMVNIKILKLLFIFIMIIVDLNFYLFKKIKNINKAIIESKYYKSFDKMKRKFIKDSYLKHYIKKISIIKHVYNKNNKFIKKKKNNIHICVSLNDRYVYPLLVSIESVLINCDKQNTYITYYILCAPDLREITLFKLKSLVYKYPLNLEMIFYNMGNNFIKLYDWRVSQAAYYRTLAPIIIDLKRIIYLDGDTLTLKDLNDMYKLDFNNNYVLGFLDFISHGVDHLGLKSEKYINSGVILFNLEKVRNDNIMYKLLNVTFSGVKLYSQDQTVMNYVFYPQIGRLPIKYGVYNFYDFSDTKKYLRKIRTPINITELEEAIKDPAIIHHDLCYPKVWTLQTVFTGYNTLCEERKNCSCKKYQDLWFSYASKTDYYSEILNYTERKEYKFS